MRLGFGISGPLGQKWFSGAKTRELIESALAGGVTHFDTAPFYFDAEARLGAALGASDAFISTKTGTLRLGRSLVKDFTEKKMRADVEESLRRLGREQLDLLYLHGPTVAEINESAPVLSALKSEGKIARAGVCGEGAPLLYAVESGFDAIMGIYNAVDRRHAAIFAKAKEKSVLTVAVAPMAHGFFDPGFYAPSSLADIWRLFRAAFRGRYRREEIAAVKAAMGGAAPASAAIGFVLADPNIDIVMTTTTKRRHLSETLAAAAIPIDVALYARLKALTLDPTYGGA